MKKLLSVLGVITLTGTLAPNVVACHKKATNNNDNATAQDIEVLHDIQSKAISVITEKLKARMYVDSGKNNLTKIYTKVDSGNSIYQLSSSNSEDKKLANYFINDFNNIFETINRSLQNEYSNYFPDAMPLTFEEERSVINVNFVNVEAIKNKFPVDINPEPFRAVRIDFKAVININFKNLFASFEISTVYNVAENTSALRMFSEQATTNLVKYIQDYFLKLENADFSTNEIFKPLYDEVQWDLSKNIKVLDNILKSSFKNYINSKKEFKDIEITYNAVNFIENVTKTELNAENKGYDRFLHPEKPPSSLGVAQWISNNPFPTEFVEFYREKVGPVFSTANGDNVSLGSFRGNWSYINVYGMGLTGNIKDSDGEDLSIMLHLPSSAIEKKLMNWGKIIIAFFDYYGIKDNYWSFANGTNLYVSKQLFKNLVQKNNKDGLKSVTKLLVEDFKNSDDAKELEDIELFNLVSHPLFEKVKGEKQISWEELFWNWDMQNNPWAVLFTFGTNYNTGLYYAISEQGIEVNIITGAVDLGISFGIQIKK